jgi:hypothetical protein
MAHNVLIFLGDGGIRNWMRIDAVVYPHPLSGPRSSGTIYMRKLTQNLPVRYNIEDQDVRCRQGAFAPQEHESGWGA